MPGPWDKYKESATAPGPWDKYTQQQSPDFSNMDTMPAHRTGQTLPITKGQKVKDYLVGPTEPATSVKDFALRVAPESVRKLIPRVAYSAYEAVKGQTDPIVESLSTLQPTGLRRKMEGNAANTLSGLAQGMAAPTGLMGYDAFKQAWASDPAGSALAVLPMAKGAKNVAPTLRNLTGGAMEAGAKKLTDMTLKQPTVLKPSVRENNITTALEGNFQPNAKGVDKLNAAIRGKENRIQSEIAAGNQAGIRGSIQQAIDNMESLRKDANLSSDPAANNALIDAEIQKLQSNPLADAQGTIEIGNMQKMKVNQGREIQKSYGEQKPQFANQIDKARVRGFKEELEQKFDASFPELSSENRQLGDFYQLKKSLERAASRIENNQGIGIGLPIKSGAGAGLGSVFGATGAATGAAIGTLIGIVEHPSVAPKLAQALYRASKKTITKRQALRTAKQRLADLKMGMLGSMSNQNNTAPQEQQP